MFSLDFSKIFTTAYLGLQPLKVNDTKGKKRLADTIQRKCRRNRLLKLKGHTKECLGVINVAVHFPSPVVNAGSFIGSLHRT